MKKLLIVCITLIVFISCVEANRNKNIGYTEKTAPNEIKEDKPFNKSKGLLICKEPKINYGDVKKGDTIVQKFKFYNRGEETVEILGYDPSCNCTALEVNKTIVKPKDSTVITMVVETKNKIFGEHVVTTTLKTNGQRTFYLLSTNFSIKE